MANSKLKSFLQGRYVKHPLHPLMVHLPVGLWIGSFVSDIIFMASGNSNFATFSYYAILFGLVSVLLAVPTGIAEYLSIPANTAPKTIATTHMVMNVLISALFLINILMRYNIDNQIPIRVTQGQFFLSLISIVLLGASGYLGGLLVYDHGIGFKPQLRNAQEREPRERGRAA